MHGVSTLQAQGGPPAGGGTFGLHDGEGEDGWPPVRVVKRGRSSSGLGEAEFDALIASVYRVATEPEAATLLFRRLDAAFDAAGSAVLVRNRDLVLTRIAASTERDEARADYVANWAWRNPLEPITARLPAGAVVTETMQMPAKELRRLDFYNGFLRKHDMPHLLTVKLWRSERGSAVLDVLRDHAAGPFGDASLALGQRLFSHFRAAMTLSEQVAGRGVRDWTASFLDMLPVGIALLDQLGWPLHCNAAARALLDARDGLSLTGAGLRATACGGQGTLDGAIGFAIRGDGEGRRRGSCVMVERPSGERPLLVVVNPLLDKTDILGSRAPAAVLSIVPGAAGAMPIELLRSAFGLTLAEARIAAAIGAGRELSDAARELGLTVASSRQYLQRVFRKTGTGRQSELAHLLTLLGTSVDAGMLGPNRAEGP